MQELIQCSNCGGYKVYKELMFLDPKTGKQQSGLGYCMFILLAMLCILGLGVLAIAVEGTEGSTLVWGVILAVILIFLWRSSKEAKSDKSAAKVYKYKCELCGKEWDDRDQSKAVTVRPDLLEKGEQRLERRRRRD